MICRIFKILWGEPPDSKNRHSISDIPDQGLWHRPLSRAEASRWPGLYRSHNTSQCQGLRSPSSLGLYRRCHSWRADYLSSVPQESHHAWGAVWILQVHMRAATLGGTCCCSYQFVAAAHCNQHQELQKLQKTFSLFTHENEHGGAHGGQKGALYHLDLELQAIDCSSSGCWEPNSGPCLPAAAFF